MEIDRSWIRATLPVRFGGFGLQYAVQLAPSAYLASATCSTDLIHQVLLPQFHDSTIPMKEEALAVWANGDNKETPEDLASHKQR